MSDDVKADLRRYLQEGRDALVWKLADLDEYDVRRPLTPTGTNLLGLVKHLACVEAEYFGSVFDKPFGEDLAWLTVDTEPNDDMWARPEESREDLVALYRRVWAHADTTLDALPLDAPGHVPWWGPTSNPTTLGRILVHVTAEVHRHAGHADVVRELIDGSVGHREGNDNMPPGDGAWWSEYRERLESAAQVHRREQPDRPPTASE